MNLFVTGIDTGVGKSYCVGLLAKYFLQSGKKAITQKIAQTGSAELSEDIILHRKIMGIPILDIDKKGVTCPYCFSFPASPHLSARLSQSEIEIEKIQESTEKLNSLYDIVIIEGVGGLNVPLTQTVLVSDYIADNQYPVILVSSPKLGSINHTLLSLEAMKHRNIKLLGVLYNLFFKEKEDIIKDTKQIIKKYLKKYGFPELIIDIQPLKHENKLVQLEKIFNLLG